MWTSASRASWTRWILLISSCSALLACGKEGPPRPPVPHLPAALTPEFRQVGAVVEIRFTLPTNFADGTPMETFEALEIYLAAAPAVKDHLPPAPPAKTFFGAANRFSTLTETEVRERMRDGRAVLRYAMEDLKAAADGYTGTFWGFILLGPQGQRGVPSEQASFLAVPPLPPATGLTAASEEGGLRLAFVPPEGAKTIRVTRSLGEGPPVVLEDLPGGATGLLDPNARHGTEYAYAAQAASDPQHWSVPAELRAAYADVFPPGEPALVQYLPLNGKAWVKAAPAHGAVTYRFYRRCPGEDWTLLAEEPDPMAAVEASICDFGAAAVDASGNQSAIVQARREEP